MTRKWSKEDLSKINKLYTSGTTLVSLQKLFKTGRSTMVKALISINLPVRSRIEANRASAETLSIYALAIALYDDGYSGPEVAQMMHPLSPGGVKHIVYTFVEKKRTITETMYLKACRGVTNAKTIMRKGYRITHICPNDPYYSMGIKGTGKHSFVRTVREHRYVMAKHIGRPLEKWEVVHHRNHIRDDNRIENLEMVSGLTNLAESVSYNYIKNLEKENRNLKAELEFWHEWR